jgi:hypothetical protein
VYGGDPTNGDLPNPNPGALNPSCAGADGGAVAGGALAYRLGGQVWKWTATFEAFVSRFPLVDPEGRSYTATPAGMYRFVAHGVWHRRGIDTPYTRVSRGFTVSPWTGITVTGAGRDAAGHLTFAAGPSRTLTERRARNTARPPLARGDTPVTFTIGPVDFPDTVRDQRATGALFLNSLRGYSAASPAEVEHYCLDCTFRPWLDATDQLVATVVIHRAGGGAETERLTPDAAGNFASRAMLGPADTATVTIADAWGDSTAAPVTVS